MSIGWDFKEAKSFGNGILRITVKDMVIVALALAAGIVAWRDLKNTGNKNAENYVKLEAKVDTVIETQGTIKDRVLVLETIARSTRSSVNQIKNEEIFDPDVTQVKVKK